TAGAGGEPGNGEPRESRLRTGTGTGRRYDQRTDSAGDGGEQHRRGRGGATAEPGYGELAYHTGHARRSDIPDSGRDQGAGGAGPVEDLYGAGGGGDRAEDRDRPV